MRLWSIHPKYLDGIGLVALWRESLLAQKVLKEIECHPLFEIIEGEIEEWEKLQKRSN